MEAEVSDLVGAERGERAPEERLTHRNGYRSRAWSTRAGELCLGRYRYLMAMTIESGPIRCSARVVVKPASFIQPMQSAAV